MTIARVLTVRQPWADLIASGAKSIEVRSWRVDYRGPLVIAAAGREPRDYDRARRGVLVCLVELVDCRLGLETDRAAAGGVDVAGLWAWVLQRPRALAPLPWRGALHLQPIDEAQLQGALGAR